MVLQGAYIVCDEFKKLLRRKSMVSLYLIDLRISLWADISLRPVIRQCINHLHQLEIGRIKFT